MDFKVYMLATVDTTGRNKGNSAGDKDAGMQVSWREARPERQRETADTPVAAPGRARRGLDYM